MKFKLITAILFLALTSQYSTVFADEAKSEGFDPALLFSDYVSYTDLNWGDYYAVENNENKKAVFYRSSQITDFIYDYIYLEPTITTFIVSQNIDGVNCYGLLDSSYIINDEYLSEKEPKYILPVEYKNIEYKVITDTDVFISTDFDGNEEFYLIKTRFLSDKDTHYNSTYDIEYEDMGKLIKIKSLADIPNPSLNSMPDKIKIEGLENCYIMQDNTGFYKNITDESGRKLIETNFREVDDKLSVGDLLVVYYPEGMADLSAGVLNKKLEVVVPKNFYSSINFIETDGTVYIEATSYIDLSTDYYDVDGNIVDKVNIKKETSCSDWAAKSIENAIKINIVPQELQSDYTEKITRKEFCSLAVQTYMAKTNKNIDFNAPSPFIDTDDIYITAAYNLKIAAGVGDNRFAPDNNITRQEAAVMLNNLASLLEIDNNESRKERFVDESYFADWAKASIYRVANIKSNDAYVMTGTGNGKFSPWMNYTREQAIATMWRIYNC